MFAVWSLVQQKKPSNQNKEYRGTNKAWKIHVHVKNIIFLILSSSEEVYVQIVPGSLTGYCYIKR